MPHYLSDPPSPLVRTHSRGQSLLNLGELNERRGVRRAHRALMFTPRVRPLQRTAHGDCDRNGIASVGSTAHKIPFWTRSDVTGKAISAEPIDDRHETAQEGCVGNRRALRRDLLESSDGVTGRIIEVLRSAPFQ